MSRTHLKDRSWRYLKGFFLSMCGLCGFSPRVNAQPSAAPRVFIECNACDDDYLRQELRFLDLVRDRKLADVAVLVTSLSTAAGGSAFSVHVVQVGHANSAGDTLHVVVRPDATSNEQRQALVRAIKVGVLPYVRSGLALEHLDVVYHSPAPSSTAAQRTHDPWNQWVFRAFASGSFASDDNYSSRGGEGSLGASRTTEAYKFEFSARGSVNRETFRLADGERVVSLRQSWSAKSLTVRSVSDHLSVGTRAGIESSVFQNTRRDARLLGAVEYDFFRYQEATQRQFIMRYSAGIRSARYVDTTIYEKLRETRPLHEFVAAVDIKQAWGNVYGSTLFSQYLHERSRSRLSFDIGLDYRIIAGLSLNFGANYSRIRDQLNIPGAAPAPPGALRASDLPAAVMRAFAVKYPHTIPAGANFEGGNYVVLFPTGREHNRAIFTPDGSFVSED